MCCWKITPAITKGTEGARSSQRGFGESGGEQFGVYKAQ